MHNIEKSAFRRGEYVGYGAGRVWRITKSNSSYGNWCAMAYKPGSPELDSRVPMLFSFRLRDLSEKLETIKA